MKQKSWGFMLYKMEKKNNSNLFKVHDYLFFKSKNLKKFEI